jgi:hypothetical protein
VAVQTKRKQICGYGSACEERNLRDVVVATIIIGESYVRWCSCSVLPSAHFLAFTTAMDDILATRLRSGQSSGTSKSTPCVQSSRLPSPKTSHCNQSLFSSWKTVAEITSRVTKSPPQEQHVFRLLSGGFYVNKYLGFDSKFIVGSISTLLLYPRHQFKGSMLRTESAVLLPVFSVTRESLIDACECVARSRKSQARARKEQVHREPRREVTRSMILVNARSQC